MTGVGRLSANTAAMAVHSRLSCSRHGVLTGCALHVSCFTCRAGSLSERPARAARTARLSSSRGRQATPALSLMWFPTSVRIMDRCEPYTALYKELAQCPARHVREAIHKRVVAHQVFDYVTIYRTGHSVGRHSASPRHLPTSHWIMNCRPGRGWVTIAAAPSMARAIEWHDWTGGGGLLRSPILRDSLGSRSRVAQANGEFSKAGCNRRRQPRHAPAWH